MKRKVISILTIFIVFLTACSGNAKNQEVEYLSGLAIENRESFSISPTSFIPVENEDGYWTFELYINNYSNSNAVVDMKSHLKIYYKDGENWYEIGNNVIYKKTWWIPPTVEGEMNIWWLLIEPSIRSDDITFRIIVDGDFEGESDSHIAGMVEYIIENGKVAMVNSLE